MGNCSGSKRSSSYKLHIDRNPESEVSEIGEKRAQRKLTVSFKSEEISTDSANTVTSTTLSPRLLVRSDSKIVPIISILKSSSPISVPIDNSEGPLIISLSSTSNKSFRTSIIYNRTVPWIVSQFNTSHLQLTDFEFGAIIGKGSTSVVSLAHTKGKYMAFKCLSKDSVLKGNRSAQMFKEKRILLFLTEEQRADDSTPKFFASLFGTFSDAKTLFLTTEYLPGGTLARRLKKRKVFSSQEAKFYSAEILLAVEYLQTCDIVHRDLTPDNILIDARGHLKLVDFGCSVVLTSNADRMHTICGTPAYHSPEQLDSQSVEGYSKVVDWWAFGVLLYELMAGSTPFSEDKSEGREKVRVNMLQNGIEYPVGFDKHTKSLITGLLTIDINKRITTAVALKAHPFYKELNWTQVLYRKYAAPFVPSMRGEGDAHYHKVVKNAKPVQISLEEVRSGDAFENF